MPDSDMALFSGRQGIDYLVCFIFVSEKFRR